MMKGGHYQQNYYLIVIGVHLTVHLTHPNNCSILRVCDTLCVYMLVCVCVCVFVGSCLRSNLSFYK